MLGLGGFGGQGVYGMGIELGFKYPAKAGMKHASSDFRKLRVEANRTDKALAASMKGMQRGFKVMAIGGALGAAAMGMSALDMHTEQAKQNVKSLGYSGEEVDSIFRNFHKMVRDEDLPVNFKRGTDAIYAMSSAGIKLKDTNAVMRHSAFLAKGAIGDITDAIPIMGITYEQMFDKMEGTTEDKFKRIADVFAGTVKTYRTTLPGLSKEFSDVVGYIPRHWGLEKAVPLIGTLIGTMMGQTGTGIKSFITGIPKAQAVLGMSFVDSQGREKDPLEILQQIKRRFGETIEADEKLLLEKAFTKEGMGALVLLMNLEKRYIEGRHAVKEFGLSENMARINADSLEGSLQNVGNKLNMLGDTLGENGLPLKTWTNNLDDALAKLDEIVQRSPMFAKSIIWGAGLSGSFLLGAGLIKVFTSAAGIWGVTMAKVFGATLGAQITATLPFIISTALAYVGAKQRILDYMGYSSFDEAEKMSKIDRWELSDPKTGRQLGFGDTYGYRDGMNTNDPLNSNYSIKYTDDISEENIKRWGGKVDYTKKESSPQNNFNGTINPTIVIQGDDPELKKKVKDFLAESMQEVKWQMMRKGESPVEVTQ